MIGKCTTFNCEATDGVDVRNKMSIILYYVKITSNTIFCIKFLILSLILSFAISFRSAIYKRFLSSNICKKYVYTEKYDSLHSLAYLDHANVNGDFIWDNSPRRSSFGSNQLLGVILQTDSDLWNFQCWFNKVIFISNCI